jgi:hypothetical protein
LKILRSKYAPIAPVYSRQLSEIIEKLLNKSSSARPSIQEILNFESMKEKMKLYGYSMPDSAELKLLHNRDKEMQRMVANQKQAAPTRSQEKTPKLGLNDLLQKPQQQAKRLEPS